MLSVLGAAPAHASDPAGQVANPLAPTENVNDPGCGNLTVWQPKITSGFSSSMSRAEEASLAPGNFSAVAKEAFGAAAAKLLAGHHVHWLSSTSCTRVPVSFDLPPGQPPSTSTAITAAYQPQQTNSPIWSGYEVPAESGYQILDATLAVQVPPAMTPPVPTAAGSA